MEKRTFTYNEKEYAMLLPPARPAMKLCNRVAALIGPLIAVLGQDVKKGEGLLHFSSAMSGIDPDTLDAIMMDAIKEAKVQCEGMNLAEPVQFTKHFDAERGSIYPVCIWCLWECVKDFFPQLGTFAPVAKKAAEKAFQSLKDGKVTI